MTHEFSIVEAVVGGLLDTVYQHNIDRVTEVRFRRGSAFSEAALRQAFEVLSRGTPLEGAALKIDTVNLDYTCICGRQQVITSDDLIGHMFVCPDCGHLHEVDEAHDLEFISAVAADSRVIRGG